MAQFAIESECEFAQYPDYQFTISVEGDLWGYGRGLDYEYEITNIVGYDGDGNDLIITPELRQNIEQIFKLDENRLWNDQDLLERVDEQNSEAAYDAKVDVEFEIRRGN